MAGQQLIPGDNSWLHLDSVSNAIDDLERCHDFLTCLPEPIRWKWAAVALHQALYGFAVLAVTPSDSRAVMRDRKKGEPQLISVREALERVQDPTRVRAGASALVLTDADHAAIERLRSEFRNSFLHFAPKGWAIEVAAISELFEPVVGAIRRVACESGAVLFLHEADEAWVDELLRRIRALAVTA